MHLIHCPAGPSLHPLTPPALLWGATGFEKVQAGTSGRLGEGGWQAHGQDVHHAATVQTQTCHQCRCLPCSAVRCGASANDATHCWQTSRHRGLLLNYQIMRGEFEEHTIWHVHNTGKVHGGRTTADSGTCFLPSKHRHPARSISPCRPWYPCKRPPDNTCLHMCSAVMWCWWCIVREGALKQK